MSSIRTHTGPIDLCGSCGQPCYQEEIDGVGLAWSHFDEQWDGIFCEQFPFAGEPLGVKLDQQSVDDIREQYPDTNPDRPSPPFKRA